MLEFNTKKNRNVYKSHPMLMLTDDNIELNLFIHHTIIYFTILWNCIIT